jgi:uncharacterized protein YceH (UPF0502 family)
MSMDTTPATQLADAAPSGLPAPPTWEPLSVVERRIVGVLIEKQRTSKGDADPLTLNALITGCNQKTNRDPILELTEAEVDETARGLQRRGLITRVIMGRADRFRPEVHTAWTPRILELSVLAELLLRGPQTKGDLRVRASRMAVIDSLEELDDVLKPLLERGLAVYLTEPDRRGAVLTHGFHPADEFARLKVHYAHAPASVAGPDAPAARAASGSSDDGRLAEIDALKARVAALEAQLADLRKELGLPVE